MGFLHDWLNLFECLGFQTFDLELGCFVVKYFPVKLKF